MISFPTFLIQYSSWEWCTIDVWYRLYKFGSRSSICCIHGDELDLEKFFDNIFLPIQRQDPLDLSSSISRYIHAFHECCCIFSKDTGDCQFGFLHCSLQKMIALKWSRIGWRGMIFSHYSTRIPYRAYFCEDCFLYCCQKLRGPQRSFNNLARLFIIVICSRLHSCFSYVSLPPTGQWPVSTNLKSTLCSVTDWALTSLPLPAFHIKVDDSIDVMLTKALKILLSTIDAVLSRNTARKSPFLPICTAKESCGYYSFMICPDSSIKRGFKRSEIFAGYFTVILLVWEMLSNFRVVWVALTFLAPSQRSRIYHSLSPFNVFYRAVFMKYVSGYRTLWHRAICLHEFSEGARGKSVTGPKMHAIHRLPQPAPNTAWECHPWTILCLPSFAAALVFASNRFVSSTSFI